MWLLGLFFYLGFYRDILIGAYDEFVLVLKGLPLCALLTTAMTFAYRAAEYSRSRHRPLDRLRRDVDLLAARR